jgi:hypothetical protein
MFQRSSGLADEQLPYLDLNYGIGDRVQLTWQISWDTERPDGGPSVSGLSASVFGIKWRFCDEGGGGWQISAFPQFTFVNPGSGSDRRGLAAAASGFLLPMEIEKDLGLVSANLEVGRVLAPQGGDDLLGVGGGWIAGLVLGREIAHGVELDAEVHDNRRRHPDRHVEKHDTPVLNRPGRPKHADGPHIFADLRRPPGPDLSPDGGENRSGSQHLHFEEIVVQYDFEIRRVLDIKPDVVGAGMQEDAEIGAVPAGGIRRRNEKVVVPLLFVARHRVGEKLVSWALGIAVQRKDIPVVGQQVLQAQVKNKAMSKRAADPDFPRGFWADDAAPGRRIDKR